MIGELFGNYRALSQLGEGGMGAVYLAEHPDIGRKVAVKVLRAEFSRENQLLTRFLNEARAANAIRHPNIIEILDTGTTASGRPYLVMELLEGETLNARIRRLGQLPLSAALEFAYQTASAVGAAHRKGIVHRDLKPDNLFIIADPLDAARERIKVLDFGIAKLQTAPKDESVRTRTGTLMGTPVYMSPEQCLGTREVDQRSDIYSLGVILFEMVTGKPPFYSQGFGELVHMHLNVPPPAPRTLAPNLPEPIEALILKMLAKTPEQRFATMVEVQAALKTASQGSFAVKGVSNPDFPNGTLPIASGPTVNLATPRPRHSTTLSTGTGERPAQGASGSPRRRRSAAMVAIVAAAVASFVAGLVVMVRRAPVVGPLPATREVQPVVVSPPPSPAPPAPVRTVQLSLDTRPEGARVVDVAGGEARGTTPVQLDVPAGDRALELRFEKDGFLPATRSVRRDSDQSVLVDLQPRPPPPRPKKKAPRPHRPAAADEPAKL